MHSEEANIIGAAVITAGHAVDEQTVALLDAPPRRGVDRHRDLGELGVRLVEPREGLGGRDARRGQRRTCRRDWRPTVAIVAKGAMTVARSANFDQVLDAGDRNVGDVDPAEHVAQGVGEVGVGLAQARFTSSPFQ